MRGEQKDQGALFSYVHLEDRIPSEHPLRRIRVLVDGALAELDGEFEGLYSDTGRPSIPPEQLLRALLLQYLYGIRSERLLMEQLDYNLLFRWFVGLGIDDRVWDATTFTKNRDRLLNGEMALRFLESVVGAARAAGLTSDEHFSVDGTMIQAWAGQKSFKRKDGEDEPGPQGGGRNADVDFRGTRRRNDTHGSTTDPDARSYRKGKGQESKLCYLGHVVIENRNGLVVGADLTLATGTAERDAALAMMEDVPRAQRATLGADRGYDVRSFAERLRAQGVVPHVAQKTRSAIDARTTRHEGYRISQVIRKIVEHPFGWLKAAAGLRQTKHRGRPRVTWDFRFGMAAYNLVRITNLTEAPA